MTIKNANLIIYSEILLQFILRICLAKRENNYFPPKQIHENLRMFYLKDLILTRKLDYFKCSGNKLLHCLNYISILPL